jgi:hypothetical protein
MDIAASIADMAWKIIPVGYAKCDGRTAVATEFNQRSFWIHSATIRDEYKSSKTCSVSLTRLQSRLFETLQISQTVMHSLLYQIAKKALTLTTREEILAAITSLEDLYDSLDEMEMEAADKLLEDLNKRLHAATA